MQRHRHSDHRNMGTDISQLPGTDTRHIGSGSIRLLKPTMVQMVAIPTGVSGRSASLLSRQIGIEHNLKHPEYLPSSSAF